MLGHPRQSSANRCSDCDRVIGVHSISCPPIIRRTRRGGEADTPGRALLGRQNPVEAVVGKRLRAGRVLVVGNSQHVAVVVGSQPVAVAEIEQELVFSGSGVADFFC